MGRTEHIYEDNARQTTWWRRSTMSQEVGEGQSGLVQEGQRGLVQEGQREWEDIKVVSGKGSRQSNLQLIGPANYWSWVELVTI